MKDHLKKSKSLNFLVHKIDHLVSIIILLVMIGVVAFAAIESFNLFQSIRGLDPKQVLRTVALIIVLVKAYRVLVFYMRSHHVSVRYIVAISIIAPSVELIFTPENRSIEMNILYAAFAIANLIVYLKFYKQLDRIDEDLAEEQSS